MIKFDSPVKNIAYLFYRWSCTIIDPVRAASSLYNFPGFFQDLIKYSRMDGAEPIRIINTYPTLNEKTAQTPFDRHYFYQDIWAARKIYLSRTKTHYDIGSNIEFVGFLSTFTKVVFVDIRPLKVHLHNFRSIKGDILNLPFKTGSIHSLSCLHVAEHIGLGRYGDHLDPQGTRKACNELSRVLAKGGRLYFSLAIGDPRVCFNSHRVHSIKQILEYFGDLKLVQFSAVTDEIKFVENISPRVLRKPNYACGLFTFTKR